ncbi:MAG: GEVED domain-containing protein [Candidatus Chryseobacterium colombiense]|nr:GEVED domain-containing protein [Chryseobacterium sp.]WEK71510.1 MAG: GEVED domain-containing protein [Chryseobacterium sp.]
MIKNLLFILLFATVLFQAKTLEEKAQIAFTVPTNVNVSTVTTSTATVSWDAIAGVSNFTVEFRPVGSNAWAFFYTNVNIINLVTLIPCTSYEVRIKETATGDTSNIVTFTTFYKYCQSASTDSNLVHISNVTVTPVGALQMISNSNALNYMDYRGDSARKINLNVGSVGNILSVNASWTGTQAVATTVSAWIDFNANGTFESSEKIMETSGNTSTPVSANFNVPLAAINGVCGTTMRVLVSSVMSSTGCGIYTYGETEDYLVNFISSNLAINELKKIEEVNIYPNPVSDILNISGITSDSDFEIYNAAGQKISGVKIKNKTVNVSRLLKGVYFIQINSMKLKFIKK